MTSGAIVTTALVPMFGNLERAAIWGGVLLLSFLGWGGLVGSLAFPGWRVDVGLRLLWGMAAVVAAGGAASVASVATRTGVLVLVVAGTAVECLRVHCGWDRPAPATPRTPRPLGTTLVLLVAAIATATQYGASEYGERLSTDDFTAYLAFPEKILATGTLVDPFNLRRLAAYGGQSFLHALVLVGSGDVVQIALFDMGICLVIVLALVVGDRGRAPLGLWVLAILLLLTLPDIHGNSTSLMSGLVVFLGLFRTASSDQFDAHRRRGGVVLGLLAAASASLRHSYIGPALAFLVFFYAADGLRALRAPRARWRQLAELAIAPATMLVVLLPWVLLSYRSSGTPLYPLFPGYYRSDPLTADSPNVDRWTFLWMNLRYCRPVLTIPLLFVAAVLVRWRSTRGALPALAGASLVGFVAIVWGFPRSDVVNMSRYYFAFSVATALAVSMHVGSLPWADWRRDPLRTALPALIVLVAIVLQLRGVAALAYRNYLWMGSLIADGEPPKSEASVQRYHALQARVPAGEPLLVMLDRPYWLDFARNPIDVIDVPAQVSPPPGMPLDDDEALVDYLRKRGFRYLAFVRPTRSENQFRRKGWEQMLGPPASPLWGGTAPNVLKVFDRFESLMTTRRRLYDDGSIVALDLASPSGGNGDWF